MQPLSDKALEALRQLSPAQRRKIIDRYLAGALAKPPPRYSKPTPAELDQAEALMRNRYGIGIR